MTEGKRTAAAVLATVGYALAVGGFVWAVSDYPPAFFISAGIALFTIAIAADSLAGK